MKTAELLSMIILLMGLASSCASSKGQADILRMIADAKTPADHEAIAEYYDQQTTEAEGSGHLHEAMAQEYRDADTSAVGFARALRKDRPIL